MAIKAANSKGKTPEEGSSDKARSVAKAPVKAAAKSEAPATVTLRHLAATLAEQHDLPKK